MRLVQCTRQVLNMVTNLVGYHIRVGKGVTLNTQLTFHLGKKREIDIQLLVARAVERTHRSSSRATSRVYLIAEQNQCGIQVFAPAILLENLCPNLLGAG